MTELNLDTVLPPSSSDPLGGSVTLPSTKVLTSLPHHTPDTTLQPFVRAKSEVTCVCKAVSRILDSERTLHKPGPCSAGNAPDRHLPEAPRLTG